MLVAVQLAAAWVAHLDHTVIVMPTVGYLRTAAVMLFMVVRSKV